jgi:hypothetical protein
MATTITDTSKQLQAHGLNPCQMNISRRQRTRGTHANIRLHLHATASRLLLMKTFFLSHVEGNVQVKRQHTS